MKTRIARSGLFCVAMIVGICAAGCDSVGEAPSARPATAAAVADDSSTNVEAAATVDEPAQSELGGRFAEGMTETNRSEALARRFAEGMTEAAHSETLLRRFAEGMTDDARGTASAR